MKYIYTITDYFIFLFIIGLTFSCSKDNNPVSSELHAPVLKGFELRDNVGNSIGVIGQPDIKLGEKGNHSLHNKFFFISFPNPNFTSFYSGHFFVEYLDLNAPFEKATLWVERAAYGTPPVESVNYLGSQNFLANPIMITRDSLGQGRSDIVLDVSSWEPGYYRVNLQIDDVHLWDNIIVNKVIF